MSERYGLLAVGLIVTLAAGLGLLLTLPSRWYYMPVFGLGLILFVWGIHKAVPDRHKRVTQRFAIAETIGLVPITIWLTFALARLG